MKGEGKWECPHGVTVISYCSSFGLEIGAGKGRWELQELLEQLLEGILSDPIKGTRSLRWIKGPKASPALFSHN